MATLNYQRLQFPLRFKYERTFSKSLCKRKNGSQSRQPAKFSFSILGVFMCNRKKLMDLKTEIYQQKVTLKNLKKKKIVSVGEFNGVEKVCSLRLKTTF